VREIGESRSGAREKMSIRRWGIVDSTTTNPRQSTERICRDCRFPGKLVQSGMKQGKL